MYLEKMKKNFYFQFVIHVMFRKFVRLFDTNKGAIFCPSSTENIQHFICWLFACLSFEVEENAPSLLSFDKVCPWNQRLALKEPASEML